MRQLDHFALLAPFYDRVFQPKDLQPLRELLKLPVDGWLLDAGGGTGRIAEALRDQVAGIVVVDVSTAMLQQARRKAGLQAVCGPVEHLPFADASFERVLVVDAFHHFSAHRDAAADLWRVLKPGGRLVVEEPDISRLVVKGMALFERLIGMRSRFYASEEMAQMFQALGGKVQIRADHPFNVWVIVDK